MCMAKLLVYALEMSEVKLLKENNVHFALNMDHGLLIVHF